MNILIAVAEFERDIIRERTMAGLAAARARGVKLGRRELSVSKAAAKKLLEFARCPQRARKQTYRVLAAELSISLGKAHSLVKGLSSQKAA